MASVILELTPEEARFLHDLLFFHNDEGPVDEGWQSPQLERLTQKVQSSLSSNDAQPNQE